MRKDIFLGSLLSATMIAGCNDVGPTETPTPSAIQTQCTQVLRWSPTTVGEVLDTQIRQAIPPLEWQTLRMQGTIFRH